MEGKNELLQKPLKLIKNHYFTLDHWWDGHSYVEQPSMELFYHNQFKPSNFMQKWEQDFLHQPGQQKSKQNTVRIPILFFYQKETCLLYITLLHLLFHTFQWTLTCISIFFPRRDIFDNKTIFSDIASDLFFHCCTTGGSVEFRVTMYNVIV